MRRLDAALECDGWTSLSGVSGADQSGVEPPHSRKQVDHENDAISQSIRACNDRRRLGTEQTGQSFGQTIKEAFSGVNELQTNADEVATRFAQGDAVEMHQAMIAMQKASTALQFTIQVRNKIIEAYQEIMRMQV